MATDTKIQKEDKPATVAPSVPPSDVALELADLRERLALVSGQLLAMRAGPKAIFDVQAHVDAVWQREEAKRRSGGDQEWYRHDKRTPTLPASLFMSNAATAKEAMRDYQERTRFRWLGSGECPVEFKRTPERVVKEK